MSDYEYENDDASAWEAAYESDPVGTSAYLAQQYAAQYAQPAVDPTAIAAQAAAAAVQYQENQRALAEQEAMAKTIDRSLAAKWGDEYAALADRASRLLHNDTKLDEIIDVQGTQAAADYIDGVLQHVKETRTPQAREWAQIKAAMPRSYYDRKMIDEALGR